MSSAIDVPRPLTRARAVGRQAADELRALDDSDVSEVDAWLAKVGAPRGP